MGIFMGVLQISCDRHARMTDLSHLFPSVVPYLSSAWCPGKFAGISPCENCLAYILWAFSWACCRLVATNMLA